MPRSPRSTRTRSPTSPRAVAGHAFGIEGGAHALHLVPVSDASSHAHDGVCDLLVLDGVYLLATSVVNTSRNAAEVVTIDTESGAVKVDDRSTAAVSDGKEPQSVGPLLARLKKLP